ncbi:MAG: hypothetical protein ISR53_04920 [Rhodospirillales bacterium]|nr:hypothetical protein [Rhodospirillales bacterium]
MKKLHILLFTALFIVPLGGCYVPASFDAEIEVGRTGFYKITFEGYMAETNLFNKVVKDNISPKEEEERVARLKNDLMRDSATKLFEYFKKGHFRIKWEKQGDILKSKMVSFLRRNENLLSISYVKSKALVSIQGTPITRANAQRMVDSGLGLQGSLKVTTDAKVISHNANKVKDGEGRKKTYIWVIKSPFDPSPKLSFNLR